MTDLFDAFDVNPIVNATVAKAKSVSKNTLFIKALEEMSKEGVSWFQFNETMHKFATFPSRAAYIAAFGKAKGQDLWVDTSASWTTLQAFAGKYMEEMGAVSADTNKKRRDALIAHLMRLWQYHGWKLDNDISKRQLGLIGDHALKYVSTTAEDGDATGEGITSFIKVTHAIVYGYYKTANALEALINKSARLRHSAYENAGKLEDWNQHPYPGCLTQREKTELDVLYDPDLFKDEEEYVD